VVNSSTVVCNKFAVVVLINLPVVVIRSTVVVLVRSAADVVIRLFVEEKRSAVAESMVTAVSLIIIIDDQIDVDAASELGIIVIVSGVINLGCLP